MIVMTMIMVIHGDDDDFGDYDEADNDYCASQLSSVVNMLPIIVIAVRKFMVSSRGTMRTRDLLC